MLIIHNIQKLVFPCNPGLTVIESILFRITYWKPIEVYLIITMTGSPSDSEQF